MWRYVSIALCFGSAANIILIDDDPVYRRKFVAWVTKIVSCLNPYKLTKISKPGIWLAGGTHYYDAIMGAIASQITSLTIVYSTVYSDADQSKHQSSASLAFVREIHRGPVNFPHKWPVTRKMFPFDDVIMATRQSEAML